MYFKFDDPASIDDWKTKEEVIESLSNLGDINEAVGWVIGEDKKSYYISAHKAQATYSASLKIPKAIIVKKIILKL